MVHAVNNKLVERKTIRNIARSTSRISSSLGRCRATTSQALSNRTR